MNMAEQKTYELLGGVGDGEVITPDEADTQIRIGVVRGVVLDREPLPSEINKSEYSEACYQKGDDGKWRYAGRYRYRSDGSFSFSEY